MEILETIGFYFKELWQLRNYEGQSRLSNFSHPKRNDAFYKKLESALLPYFEEKSFRKIAKRKFIKEEQELIHFYSLGLSKNRNGLALDYGFIDPLKHSLEKLRGRNSLTSYALKQKRLSPNFWEYDYQYPVRKSEAKDEKIIAEIRSLLTSDFHHKCWEDMLRVV